MFSMMPPWCSSITSIVTVSNGSINWPSSSLMITSGRETASSKPSRRIFSIRIERCSSPRPETRNLSGSSVCSTRKATLCTSSFSRRSKILREVTNLPSLPANGEVLTWKVIVTVGSSTDSAGRASTWVCAQMVSEIFSSPRPVMAIISPALACSTSWRSRPR